MLPEIPAASFICHIQRLTCTLFLNAPPNGFRLRCIDVALICQFSAINANIPARHLISDVSWHPFDVSLYVGKLDNLQIDLSARSWIDDT